MKPPPKKTGNKLSDNSHTSNTLGGSNSKLPVDPGKFSKAKSILPGGLVSNSSEFKGKGSKR